MILRPCPGHFTRTFAAIFTIYFSFLEVVLALLSFITKYWQLVFYLLQCGPNPTLEELRSRHVLPCLAAGNNRNGLFSLAGVGVRKYGADPLLKPSDQFH